ncbi:MAG: hypothetical protein WA655_01555 [Candidatus Korobacteraceae bacterium]
MRCCAKLSFAIDSVQAAMFGNSVVGEMPRGAVTDCGSALLPPAAGLAGHSVTIAPESSGGSRGGPQSRCSADGGRVSERSPQFLDGGVDAVVKSPMVPFRPQRLLNLVTSNHFDVALQQHSENLEWLFLQLHDAGAGSQLARSKIDFELAEARA